MAKWTDYPTKKTPEDTDDLMIYDATGKANKRVLFSGLWNWIVDKLTNAVISNLKTNNKTILGALNELNSNTFRAFNLVSYDAISDDLKTFNYGIARYSYNANGAPSEYNGYLISHFILRVHFAFQYVSFCIFTTKAHTK